MVQDELDSLKIISTLESIDGIDPLAILEKFADTAVNQEREIGKLRRQQSKNANTTPQQQEQSTSIDRDLDKLKADRLKQRNQQLESELQVSEQSER